MQKQYFSITELTLEQSSKSDPKIFWKMIKMLTRVYSMAANYMLTNIDFR